MIEKIWTICCKIKGDFYLVKEENINTLQDGNIRKFILEPEFDQNNNQTGIFNVSIDFAIYADDENKGANSALNIGRDLLEKHLQVITFLSGYKVIKLTKPIIRYTFPENPRRRKTILFGEFISVDNKKIPISNTTLFHTKISTKLERIIAWLYKGIDDPDVINTCISFFNALDLLIDEFKYNGKKRTRNIRQLIPVKTKEEKEALNSLIKLIGEEIELDNPGLADKFKSFFTSIINLSEEEAIKIYGRRADIMHGSLEINSKNKIELSTIRNELYRGIIIGVKKLLNIDKNAFPNPDELPFNWQIIDEPYTLIDSTNNDPNFLNPTK